jgi:tRNA pseudouridine55 synthase
LPLVTGSLTRLAQFYMHAEKTYEGTIRFGFSTDTYDAEGEATSPPQDVSLKADELESLASHFRGIIEQTPPPFSAKKIHGVPAYKLARKQREVVLKPVSVEIKEFEILAVEVTRLRFRARVTSGTYLRSVAHDLGQRLGCGAHLESLRRTAAAEFTVEEAHTLEELTEAAGKSSLQDFFVHPRKLLPMLPSVMADEANAARIRSGRSVNLPELSRAPQVKVFFGQRDLIAVATRIAGTLFHPKIVFPAEGEASETNTAVGRL